MQRPPRGRPVGGLSWQTGGGQAHVPLLSALCDDLSSANVGNRKLHSRVGTGFKFVLDLYIHLARSLTSFGLT